MARASQQEGVLLAGLGTAEHASDRAVEQADAVVGQAGRGVQHGRDQGGAAAEQRQRPQVLGGVAAALAGQLSQPLGMDTLGAGGTEADGAQAGQLLHNARKGLVAGRARRLPRPGQHAERRPLPGRKQRVQRAGLDGGQVAGELARDVALGHDQSRGDQPLDDARARSDDPAPAQLVHQRRGDRQGACGGQRHRQQPGQHLAPASRRIHAEAEHPAQVVELLLAGLTTDGIGGERVGADVDLLGNEAQGCVRDDVAGTQQPAGIAESAELEGVAELVGGAAAAIHRGQVSPVQGPVPDEIGLRDR